MNKVVQVTITSSNYRTLGDYLKDPKSTGYPSEKNDNKVSKDFDWESYAAKFISYTHEVSSFKNTTEVISAKSNYDQILSAFKNYQIEIKKIISIYDSKANYLDLPIKPGIKFYIPIYEVSRAALQSKGIEVVSNNDPAFKAQALIELERDNGYKKVFKQSALNTHLGDLKTQYPDLTVWIWCRSLSENTLNDGEELNGQIFNITPFINSINASYTKMGGNFSISLAPIIAKRNIESGIWEIDKSTILNSTDFEEGIFHSDLHTVKDGELIRNQILFHNMISINDLIFIRFETLENEAKQRINDNRSFLIDKNLLSGRLYDLIGLVDKNTLNSSYEQYTSEVTIEGRDLSKLFIEDGSYFYSMENKQGILYLQGSSTANNKMSNRIVSDTSYLFLGLFYNNTIEDILSFIIQQVSNITVVPNSLFSSYEYRNSEILENSNVKFNELNKRYNDELLNADLTKDEIQSAISGNKQQLLKLKKENIEKVNEFRLSSLKNILTQNVINNTSGMVFYNLYKFIKNTLNIDGVAKFLHNMAFNSYNGWKQHTYEGDNIEDDYFPDLFIYNFSNSTITSLFADSNDAKFNEETKILIQSIYEYIKYEESSLKLKDAIDNPIIEAKGIWNIVKLVIDKKVANRVPIDASLSTASGSLMNFIKKIAQEPFVEIFMDTYKDQYYITVRQPPTDQIGMLSYLTGNYQDMYNLNESDNTLTTPTVVDIEEIDISSDTLSFDDSKIYSWYNFTPQSSMIANASEFFTIFIPAVYFEEYAKIWGAKSLDLVHNYMNYYSNNMKVGGFKDTPIQAFYDMKYVIESNQYNPFMRSGVIVIKGGDRRIKVGNPIRLKSTGEIFWVDSVSNTFQINSNGIERVTTIQVSRGLVEAFIYGMKGSQLNNIFKDSAIKFTPNKTFSYFDIINTKLNLDAKIEVDVFEEVEEDVVVDYYNPPEPDTDLLNVENTEYKNPVSEYILKGYNTLDREFWHSSEINNLKDLEKALTKGSWSFSAFGRITQNYHMLLELAPQVRGNFVAFLNAVLKQGWDIQINDVGRTREEQERYYSENTNNAKPGYSKHELGLAIDMNVISMKNINGIKANTTLRKQGMRDLWLKSGIVEIAKNYNIKWGDFKGYQDHVHFYMDIDLPKNQIYKQPDVKLKKGEPIIEKRKKKVKTGTKWVRDESVIFSNFKVDKEIFNFFLTKKQFDIPKQNFTDRQDIHNIEGLIEKNIVNSDQLNLLTKNSITTLDNKLK